jgi:outer membrane lipoprotein-sorting protein
MRPAVAAAGVFLIAASRLPVDAASEPSAIAAASSAFAKVDDYHMKIVVHETAGERSQDRTYDVLFKKPLMEKIEIVAGQDKGSGIVWLGGDKVRGHHGGLLSGIHLTFDLHNSQVLTLRGDGVDTATIPAMLDEFTKVKGTVTAAPGPDIDGSPTDSITLDVADPAALGGVSRVVLYLSSATHLPLRREQFAGTQLVKSETITEMKTNVGLTDGDFPW